MKLTPKPVITTAIIILIVVVVVYMLRRVKPVKGATVSSPYGYRIHPITGKQHFHNGVDLGAPMGTPIKAILGGTVTKASYDGVNGNYIQIKHFNGISSFYGHMMEPALKKPGDVVFKEEIIGYVGSTGASTGPHVHFIIFQPDGSTVDPLSTNLIKV